MTTSEVHQERHRLLLAMKQAPDYYELAFSSAEHAGYLNGLQRAGQVSVAAACCFALEGKQVAEETYQRLGFELDQQRVSNRAAAQI